MPNRTGNRIRRQPSTKMLIMSVVVTLLLSLLSVVSTENRCGRENLQLGRIIGGTEARKHQYPWAVHFQTVFDAGQDSTITASCTGSIIGRRFVVTAAHCFFSKTAPDANIREIKLVVGEVDVTRRDRGEERPKVEDWFIHDKYDPEKQGLYDIALIKMKREIEYNENVGPICLPEAGVNDNMKGIKTDDCRALGWGRTERGKKNSDSEVLMHIQYQVESDKFCRTPDKDSKPVPFDSRLQVCASAPDNKDKSTCQGDSGSPLACLGTDEDRFYIVGVDSYGYNCGEGRMPTYYTKVESFLEWINQKMADK